MTEETQPRERPQRRDLPRDIEPYFLGLLSRGEHWNDTGGTDTADLVPRQLAYIRKQVEAGRYKLAGPMPGDGPFTGLIIIASKTAEDALAIANADPGVQSGHLRVEIYPIFLPSLQGLKINFA